MGTDLLAVVKDFYPFLSFYYQSRFSYFQWKGCLINGFKKPWPQFLMNSYCAFNNFACQPLQFQIHFSVSLSFRDSVVISLNIYQDNSNECHIKDSVDNKFWRRHLHLSDGENIQPDSSQDCNNTACRNRQVQRPWCEKYTDGRQDAPLEYHGAGYVSSTHF